MDLAASQYDFNNHALMRMSESIKEALDPNGILSPGKQGIWPRKIKERD
jgi:4-cresol dehydrogenase (hydroxylating)